jgi:predicted O-methyltransferase YrrM
MKRTIDELRATPRMFYIPIQPNNILDGLGDLINEIVKPNFTIVELGCFAGVSSELFAQNCFMLHCVDIWDLQDKTYTEITRERMLKSLEMFNEMAESYPNIFQIKGFSTEVAKEFKNNDVDMVYIDARHDYEGVKADLKAWYPKVKKGGWITGHDILLPQIKQAILETIPNSENMKVYSDESWAIQKI